MTSFADAETLRFLVNPVYQNRVTHSEQKEATKDRRMKYRKRIDELHQLMMTGASPEVGLKAVHDAFVGAAIKYIRLDRAQQLVQDELADVPAVSRQRIDASADADAALFNITDETVKAIGRSPPRPTIDSFVVRTSHISPIPPPRRRRRRAKKSHSIVDGANTSAKTPHGTGPKTPEGTGQSLSSESSTTQDSHVRRRKKHKKKGNQ